jgi:hypothetical protein
MGGLPGQIDSLVPSEIGSLRCGGVCDPVRCAARSPSDFFDCAHLLGVDEEDSGN